MSVIQILVVQMEFAKTLSDLLLVHAKLDMQEMDLIAQVSISKF